MGPFDENDGAMIIRILRVPNLHLGLAIMFLEVTNLNLAINNMRIGYIT